jgi:phosphate transport system protein
MSVHMQRELDRLKKLFLGLSTMAEENLRDSVRAALDRDRELAQRVIAVEEECLKVLALYQPVAHDLRYVVAILKINHDLERVGDLAVNIADRAIILCDHAPVSHDYGLREMATRAQTMLRRSLDAMINSDVQLAKDIWLADDGIDAMNVKIISDLEAAIEQDPKHLRAMLALIGVSRTLERIGDHATNIAKDVIYMIAGEIVRHRSRQFREKMQQTPA